ncbi:IlGF domain-containing protein [Aphelenchoides bicaudatus]|nr:IlGF domain-containing protein [Aphelenchoides bicaudatus]
MQLGSSKTWLNCWFLGILVVICIFIRQTHSANVVADIEHNVIKPPARAPSSQGLIKMCPPGGDVFTTAWQMSCGMKKRKKRSVYMRPVKRDNSENEYRALSLSEMMKFCCKYGCSFRDLLAYCDPFGDWDS